MNGVSLLLTLTLFGALVDLQWPTFRGPDGQGIVPQIGERELPMTWSEEENVAWKTAIHGKGWSTPVVWGNQVWLTTATEDGIEMSAICIDRTTGDILYDNVVLRNESPESLGNPVNSYASCSPAIEDGRVYIHFGSYGTLCLDTQTFETLWKRTDLPCRHFRGPASSVILWEDTLILTMDGVDVQYLVALDKATGDIVWRTDRTTDFKDLDENGMPTAEGDFRKAYTTPVITEWDNEPVMLSSGARAAFAYDPRDGNELWTVTYNGFSNASMPVVHDGMAFLNTGYGKANLLGVRMGGAGNVDSSHLVWEQIQSIPLRSSPVVVNGRLYMVTDNGVASCIDPETGDIIWRERLGGQYSGSPVAFGELIYFSDENGKTHIVKADESLNIVKTNTLDDGMLASPAVAGNELYLRTKTHLYRIETLP